MLSSFGWGELVTAVKDRPQFSTVKRIAFIPGRPTDYVQIPNAFIDLCPILQKVMPTILDVEGLIQRGIEVTYRL